MRLNVTVIFGAFAFIFGAFAFIFGAFITGLELSQAGGGGGIYGSVFVGVVLIVFGFVIMEFGSRPKRFSKRK
jgi:hypothetical protein